MKTKVIFRIFPDGEVIALFPEIPADQQAGHCLSYMHTGQHGAASADLPPYTRSATPEECAPLLEELRTIGYDPQVIARSHPSHHRTRVSAMG